MKPEKKNNQFIPENIMMQDQAAPVTEQQTEGREAGYRDETAYENN